VEKAVGSVTVIADLRTHFVTSQANHKGKCSGETTQKTIPREEIKCPSTMFFKNMPTFENGSFHTNPNCTFFSMRISGSKNSGSSQPLSRYVQGVAYLSVQSGMIHLDKCFCDFWKKTTSGCS
jgi:hypothetical protein